MKTAALVAVSIWACAGACAVAAIPITAACVFVMWRDYKWNR